MNRIKIKNKDEIESMRKSCRITATILDEVGSIIKPGITTEDINEFVHNRTIESGAVPSPLNYKGYPKSVCTSVDEVICHGIPSSEVVLESGSIINVDVTSYYEGFHGDASRMYFVGGREACSEEIVKLVDITYNSLVAGIKEVNPSARLGNVGAAIQKYIKSLPHKYGIVREYTGHGIGREFHEPPQVLHIGRRGFGEPLLPGMIFTIEPMINLGTANTVLCKKDGWTVTTADKKPSAQWEHTILVTKGGFEVLTLAEGESI